MAARARKVGKGKGKGRSARQKKRSRPRPRDRNVFEKTAREVEEQVLGERSAVKSAASAQKLEMEARASAILDKLDDGLTTRRRRFSEEYMISGNGTQAATLAGYSPDRADREASELLADPVVAAEVARRTAELNAKLHITQERVLTEQAAIAFSDIGEIMGEGESGAPIVLPFRQWTPAARKAIRSVKVKRVVPKKEESEQPFEILEFGLWDKPTALEKLSARLDSEKGANAGVDLANLSDKERLRIIAEVLSRGRAARDAVLKGKKKTA